MEQRLPPCFERVDVSAAVQESVRGFDRQALGSVVKGRSRVHILGAHVGSRWDERVNRAGLVSVRGLVQARAAA